MDYSTNSDMLSLKKHRFKIFLQTDPWLVAVLACFTLFTWANWLKIDNPIIDVGREIEIPARLVSGQLLYKDVETYYTPLAYYANALALLLFGHRLEVFYVVSSLLALAITLLFYRLAKRLTNGRWAALICVCMLIYCAFGPDLQHFIVPYSYGSVYAIVLCFLAVTFCDRFVCTSKTRWILAAAIASGFAGLAKQEYGVAVLGAVLVTTNLYSPQNLRTRLKRSLIVVVVAGVCALLPLALLAQQASWDNVYSSLFPVSKLSLLKQSSLFEVSPTKTLRRWLVSFVIFFAGSLVVLVSVIIARWIVKFRWFKANNWLKGIVEITASVTLARVGLSLLLLVYPIPIAVFNPLGDLSWSLPVLTGWLVFMRPKPAQHKQELLLWTLLVFSLLLNSRWLFYINFYGLFATPVILLFFTQLYYLTKPLNKLHKLVWRYLLVCLSIAAMFSLENFGYYRYAVNSSYGTFYTWNQPVARAFNQTINTINNSKVSSVLVLPEGNILNFLTATHSPSREITFLPLVLPTSEDEQEFVARMQTKPPEMIVYVDRAFPEWGYQTYAEFDPLVDQWINQKYRLIHTFPKDKGVIRVYAHK
jgi:4-amino-4-deoxy-L-arabinose transferase-like glycosyltransferase